MNRKDLKTGEIYAYSTSQRDNRYNKPRPVKLIDPDGSVVTGRRYDGSDLITKGIVFQPVNPVTMEPFGRQRVVTASRHFWRTWADQVAIAAEQEKTLRDEAAAEEAAQALVDEENGKVWAEIETLIGADEVAKFNHWERIPKTGMRMTAERLLELLRKARVDQVDLVQR